MSRADRDRTLAAAALAGLLVACDPPPRYVPAYVTPHCGNSGWMEYCQRSIPAPTLTARVLPAPKPLPTPFYRVERR